MEDHTLFSQQPIPYCVQLPDSTVRMDFALIKALCATIKTIARITVMKKVVKALKVGTGFGVF